MNKALILAGVGAAVVLIGGAWAWRRGGGTVEGAAQAAGAALVDVATGATVGAVGAVGSTVGLPTPSQTVTDPREARWIIDNVGHLEASKWSSASAYLQGVFLASGSGWRPAADSPAGRTFAAVPTDTGDEVDRLLRRYPMPADYSSAASIDSGSYALPWYVSPWGW